MNPGFRVSVDASVTAAEILTLMDGCRNTGWGRGTPDAWDCCLRQSLCVASARDHAVQSGPVKLDRPITRCGHADPTSEAKPLNVGTDREIDDLGCRRFEEPNWSGLRTTYRSRSRTVPGRQEISTE